MCRCEAEFAASGFHEDAGEGESEAGTGDVLVACAAPESAARLGEFFRRESGALVFDAHLHDAVFVVRRLAVRQAGGVATRVVGGACDADVHG